MADCFIYVLVIDPNTYYQFIYQHTYAFSLIRLKVCQLICACILNVRCCILYAHRDWRTALHSHTIITSTWRVGKMQFSLLRGSRYYAGLTLDPKYRVITG